jgi:hypothetical protein
MDGLREDSGGERRHVRVAGGPGVTSLVVAAATTPPARLRGSPCLRAQVDLGALHAELLAVVEETMHPTQASLWLRPQEPSSTAGEAPTASTHR